MVGDLGEVYCIHISNFQEHIKSVFLKQVLSKKINGNSKMPQQTKLLDS